MRAVCCCPWVCPRTSLGPQLPTQMRRGDCRACHRGHFWPLSLQATSERSACGHGHHQASSRGWFSEADAEVAFRGTAPGKWTEGLATPCPSTMRSATASSTSSTPRTRRGWLSPSERLMVTSEALDGVPILVLANKQDIETCLSIPDIKTAFSDCSSKIGRRDCLTQACSALTGKGVREGIEWMVKCVVRNVHRPPRQRDIT
ncbi:ADP-ribosylation factor-related protein 1 isoform X2 [Meles meles]|uniref:ADP-ribosylation factor-related protein 1 isoform X2 n=1 Tax=Meles meles TaxID=9662 RepID=UPI001E6999A1|nr:ADP-ribosylation factor-related protein 1 isoform X2 [Meles meles]